ncbi:MAG: ATP-binding protein [Pseudonocardia sp.]|nr:ATP-binding protein [Pseudonocardia sp.]
MTIPGGSDGHVVDRPRESAQRTTAIGGLVERDAELAALGELVAGTPDGGSLLIVQGPPGIGKSALMRHLAAAARDAGCHVLTAYGSQAESGAVFGIVRQLLTHRVAGAGAAERGRLLRGAAGLAADALGLDGPHPGRDDAARCLGLYWLCAGLAEREPLVLAVDDAQWADAASMAFFGTSRTASPTCRYCWPSPPATPPRRPG